jgi:hypothetical protein
MTEITFTSRGVPCAAARALPGVDPGRIAL